MILQCFAATTVLLITGVQSATDIGTNATTQLDGFCRRFEHRTTVLNNKLYLDGGYVNTNPMSSDPTNYTNSLLLYSDLLVTQDGMPKMRSGSGKDSSVPSVAGGALWADEINQRFYAFGGYFTSSTPSAFQTWTHDELHGLWSNVSTEGDVMSYVAHGMSAVAPDAGMGYYFGGYHDNETDLGWTAPRLYTSTLVEFDMVSRKYSNFTGSDGKGRGEGLMVFIPASTSGLLVYFGGVVQERPGGSVVGEIWIYDISLRKWYQQNATGEVPDARTRFCGVAAWPDDESSFNIYIYGGLRPDAENTNGSTALDDLYILSLPAFVWVKMYPASNQSQPSFGHHSATCNIINGTQMIVMGGSFPQTQFCDSPALYAQHNVDLGEINADKDIWYLFNQDNPPYRLPIALTKVIGGTDKGGANITAPFTNQTYDKYLFEKEYKVPQRYPTPITSGTPPAKQQSNELSRTALIGAIVGAVMGGICIGIAVFYIVGYMRRRPRKEDKNPHEKDGKGSGKMVDERMHLEELEGRERAELGSESEQRFLGEMWVEPVELEGERSGGFRGVF
ncbi:uncharacterized protein BDR25DRAFT_246528 [Lindgomyces ingoldianus]|uniref:Uncharacterized protein n=1 Tax=Lindgomyces ingoldianus TaxID=673940 RepID=A0ACB6Q8A5_9PLEO|nr:uncharacterized protein BDR25DRAFT_246528 [Lindgomyces ingoldianus]KAF2463097.1 hypothetical protein BDR25DRAFT_246528 [Lindgomyces ingoldianus]